MKQRKSFLTVRQQDQPEPAIVSPPVSKIRQRLHGFYKRFHSIFLVAASVLITLSAVLLFNATQPPPQKLTQRDINAAVERALAAAKPKPSYSSQVYEIIRPSLVRVEAFTSKGSEEVGISLGTGVVIDDGGTILTSLHIVKDAARIRVQFSDGSDSEASIIAAQPENDLAVLQPQIIPDDLKPATLTSSATLHVGDEVIAVGNPFGISNSLSDGVVSGLGRNFKSKKTGETLSNLIQFDAAVNPGNSGGPLLDRNGEVVGIVTALLNPIDQDFFVGIGFAVPIETAAAAAGSPPY
jgi:S1-C subfamily serine protease